MNVKGAKGIHFHYLQPVPTLKNRIRLKAFIANILCKQEGRAVESIDYIFCDDAYLLQINQQYLNHDTYTDIVTFDLSSMEERITADVFVSVERIKDNAHTFKASFNEELHRVIFHGALHLCGYKDKTVKQAEAMRDKERQYLDLYLIS